MEEEEESLSQQRLFHSIISRFSLVLEEAAAYCRENLVMEDRGHGMEKRPYLSLALHEKHVHELLLLPRLSGTGIYCMKLC